MVTKFVDPIVKRKLTEEGLTQLKNKIEKKKAEGKDYISTLSLMEHFHSKGANTLEEILKSLPNTYKFAFYATYNISFKFEIPNEEKHNYIYIPELNIYLDNGEYISKLSRVYSKIEENLKLGRKILFDDLRSGLYPRTIITNSRLFQEDSLALENALSLENYEIIEKKNFCFYRTDSEAVTYISTRSINLTEYIVKKRY